MRWKWAQFFIELGRRTSQRMSKEEKAFRSFRSDKYDSVCNSSCSSQNGEDDDSHRNVRNKSIPSGLIVYLFTMKGSFDEKERIEEEKKKLLSLL